MNLQATLIAWRSDKTLLFTIYAALAAFLTYFSMYGFRKPFSAATFGMYDAVLGIDYKIWLIFSQLLGYAISKYIGIRFVSELKPASRIGYLLGLVGLAEAALLIFWLVPSPFNIIILFFNGLPLGLIWGIVFSFLEGRTTSEFLGAGLSVSFIVASGVSKSVGKFLLLEGVSEQMMPFAAGLIFTIPLLLGAWLLGAIPDQSEQDRKARVARITMNRQDRRRYVGANGLGILLVVMFYFLLTALRDFRDNFASEIWIELGYGDQASIFTWTEIPVAVIVLLMISSMIFIKDNRYAFKVNHWLVGTGAAVLIGSTISFWIGIISPVLWMVLLGLGLFMSYVPFNCIFFDRMVSAIGKPANAGFLIYIADSVGYVGSVGLLVCKNFMTADGGWIDFLGITSVVIGMLGIFFMTGAWQYFRAKIT